eukprot:g6004.t1
MEQDAIAQRGRELRRLKRTKLRCCSDTDGCNQCLRRGARFLLHPCAGTALEDMESRSPGKCGSPNGGSPNGPARLRRCASAVADSRHTPRKSFPPLSAHARLPAHLRAECGSDWAMRHANDVDFPFARQGLATALYQDVPPALRLQLIGRCVLEVALEANALGVALAGADDLQDVLVHMLARVINDDANANPKPGQARGSERAQSPTSVANMSPGPQDTGAGAGASAPRG